MQKNAADAVPAPAVLWPPICLWVLILLHATLGYCYSLTRLYEFKNSTFDLGAFTQVMQTLVATGIPSSSLSPVFVEQNWFGFHFSPIFYAIAPIYALFPAPETLQAIQAICISATAWPLYLTFRTFGASPPMAFLWGVIYLLNPFILNASVWDFHESSLASPIFAFGLWAVAGRRFGALLFCAILLLLTKEHYGVAVAGFGLLWGIRHNEWKKAASVIALGIASCAIVVEVAMPYFRGGGPHAMFDKHGIMARYDWLMSWRGWVDELPLLIPEWFKYTAFLLAPLCSLQLAGIIWMLPAAGDFATILLSKWNFPRSVFAYHSVTAIPMLIIAAYQGGLYITKHKWLENTSMQRLSYYVLLFTSLQAWIFAPFPLPLSRNIWEMTTPSLHLSHEDAQAINEIRQLLPDGAPTGVQCNIGTWFSSHHPLFIFPYETERAQYVVLNLQFPFAKTLNVMAAPYAVYAHQYMMEVNTLLESSDWGIAYWHEPWLVMQRGTKDRVPSRNTVISELKLLDIQHKAIEALNPHEHQEGH